MSKKPFYCKKCGDEFPLYFDVVKHVLEEHRELLSEYEIRKYEKQLAREKWTCKDCIHAGIIYYDPYYEYDDLSDLKKGCPEGYLFDYPNPRNCPRFIPKEAKE